VGSCWMKAVKVLRCRSGGVLRLVNTLQGVCWCGHQTVLNISGAALHGRDTSQKAG
jgi:hypothetical protein